MSNFSPLIRVEQVSCLPPRLVMGRSKSGREATVLANYLLNNVSFDVFAGDRTAIVGASGAGKTTLLRVLNRLSEPTSGALYFEHQNYTQIPVVRLRQQVALVLQESRLLGMTVRQALEYPLVLRRLSPSTIQGRVEKWVERFHIPTEWLSRTEFQLSVGQRQLVAIVRALVIQPKVLLLDEPTAAQDAGRAELLLNVLTELASTSGMAILMVNHQLDLAQKFASRVLHLHQGQLAGNAIAQEMDWKRLQQSLKLAESQRVEEWGD